MAIKSLLITVTILAIALLADHYLIASNSFSENQPNSGSNGASLNQDQTQPVQITPSVQDNSETSPDGTMKVTMEKNKKNSQNDYSFFVSDAKGDKKQLIYTTSLPNSESFSVPHNAWSPDNTYLFIQENLATTSSALVFKATGEPFANNTPFLDVASLFLQHNFPSAYKETTGWDSPTLLHVMTITDHDTQGSSYWFEIGNNSFQQLSTL